MADVASRDLWWPFTQHSSVKEGAVQVIKEGAVQVIKEGAVQVIPCS